MPKTAIQQEAYDKIAELVEQFASQIEVFKKTQNETETRNQFINPLFDALGWDTNNTKRRAIDSDRDVVHEDRVTIDGKSKAPDYSFRIGGKRKFFLEAKKPSVKIETDIVPSYQLRRYGWNDPEVHISILTDFEEFAVYDCTIQPKQTDTAAFARHKYITYNQYLEKFDWLWDTFSKEQVVKGSLDQFAKSIKKGTQGVDTAFLKSLDEWRNYLATSIALRNKQLSEDEINYLVQMNINRIVFIRNCEDRGAEPYGKLKGCLVNSKDEGGYFRNMYQVFEDADRKYNSGLFDFTKDTLSKSVIIDNEVISTIVDELYFPKSPYEFSVIGVEILGTAYERFLGKVIRLTPDHQAIVEEKPEVRKAGGVFYTPQYVVEYIVKQTVGKLVKGKTPDEIAKIKICDPSCGSGSFLLGAYQYLLVYHTDWHIKNYKKSRNLKDSPLTPDGRLTTHVKKQILLNNIFGVDIDTQAVEVTKLSLLMKCMEGETTASMQTTMTFERVLPTLENNIKSGNSLIDFDFYEGQIDYGEDKKIKPFNWKSAFPQVFKQGGFDSIIGNPPYVSYYSRHSEYTGDDKEKLQYLVRNYDFTKLKSAGTRFNTVMFFLEKAVKLLSENGRLGFIIDMNFTMDAFAGIREFLFKNTQFTELIKNLKAFVGVNSGQIILHLLNKKPTISDSIIIKNSLLEEGVAIKQLDIANNISKINIKNNVVLSTATTPLKKIASIKTGVNIGGASDIFLSNTRQTDNHLPFISTSTIKTKYSKIFFSDVFINFSDKLVGEVNNSNKMRGSRNVVVLGDKKRFEGDKLFIRQSASEIVATYSDDLCASPYSIFVLNTISDRDSIKFLLGILNSKFITYYAKVSGIIISGEGKQPQIRKAGLDLLPIVLIDHMNLIQKSAHNEIVKNVEDLLKLNADLKTETAPSKKEQFQGMIAFAEQRINEIVYQLYGLSKEEIAIVESQS